MTKRYFSVDTLRRNGQFEQWMDILEGEEAARDQMRRMEEYSREHGLDMQSVRLRELTGDEIKHHLINTKRGWFDSYLMKKSVEELEGIVDAELAAGQVIRVAEMEKTKLEDLDGLLPKVKS